MSGLRRLRDLPGGRSTLEHEAGRLLGAVPPLAPSARREGRIWEQVASRASAGGGVGAAWKLVLLGAVGVASLAVVAARGPTMEGDLAEQDRWREDGSVVLPREKQSVRPFRPAVPALDLPRPERAGQPDRLAANPALLWLEHGDGRTNRDEALRRGLDRQPAFSRRDASAAFVGPDVAEGRRAWRVSVDAADPAPRQGFLRMFGELPEELYFSSWFLVPDLPEIKGTFTFFAFDGRQDPADPRSELPLWSLDLERSPDGRVLLALRDAWHGRPIARLSAAAPEVPVGKWFHVEVFLHNAADDTGRISVWQDGVSVFALEGVETAPNRFVSWAIGARVVGGLSPPRAQILIDDAAMSWSPLRPGT